MTPQYLKIEKTDGTMLITINRPEVYNALNGAAKAELVSALQMANSDREVRSIILTGEGKAFCTGQDLNDRNIQGENSPVDLGHTLETEWIPLVKSLRESEKIVIGAINGVCAGAGLSVATACDLLISKPEVKYISGFSKLGLAPDAGASSTFSKRLGHQRTLEFFLFNKPLTAEELEYLGMINLVSDEYLEDAKNWASEINKLAPQSVSLIKKNTRYSADVDFESSLERETEAQRFLGNTDDYQEGLKAFFEKRAPQFKGH
ncbi:MAG: 2-(1,2-epoxy-1,2-dihydrophenyl)acetyl-CoA isomerase [Halobacteriovoraceae bacterium]|jgi:2-(1,2-epoxy-1,2-dihydrophenyl)acetyl-CoA isomerase|nr:2-(1,2-epoxy-1,2-dihydrophenyl)acetyl-CoA isomerase [Halobacteriovoraceae bacterium]MBT5095426.1 2-(1,2-epoxy-1,2-dihydrophenyl)acetyl-CoA isomerase [Halobacteriovoraceae bacterium]